VDNKVKGGPEGGRLKKIPSAKRKSARDKLGGGKEEKKSAGPCTRVVSTGCSKRTGEKKGGAKTEERQSGLDGALRTRETKKIPKKSSKRDLFEIYCVALTGIHRRGGRRQPRAGGRKSLSGTQRIANARRRRRSELLYSRESKGSESWLFGQSEVKRGGGGGIVPGERVG